jgi:DNA-binding NtrC family response regulator
VDDNPEVARSLDQLLGHKYEMIACSSYAAVEERFTARVDLVLLDIKMAPIDGLVMYGLVRSRNPSVHILLHTAYPGDASVVRTMGMLEVDGWLTKGDYSLRDLEDAIERTLKTRR